MPNPRQWPAELWMARVDDSPSWYVSCCDTPRQPEDRRYVLADWIFVDDRLPETEEYVLCLYQIYLGSSQYLDVGWYDADDGKWHICEIDNASIVAWQPLPSPPTAEQIAGYRTRTEGAP